jgi:hypothetical protein
MPYPTDPITNTSGSRWGAAEKYDFDNPQKWVTVPSVPLLDEHELTNDSGEPIASVDRAVLEEIARNNNRKVHDTGDPATLILGHTSDDPRVAEKPAKGFVLNYKVLPFKRDESGRVIYAIHGDYKIRPKNAHLIEEYPRRSVELWWAKKDIDPIAMLGGSSPERDLGVVLRHARLNHVSLDHTPKNASRDHVSPDTTVIQFRRRGSYTIENYSIEDQRMPTPRRNSRGQPDRRYNCGPDGRPMQYDDAGMDTHDTGDEGVPDEGDADDATQGMSSLLQELFQSKQWKELTSQVATLSQALTGGEGEQGGMPGEETPPELPPPGAGGAGMDAPGGDPGMGGGMPGGKGFDAPGGDQPMEEDSRRGMGERPVQMGAGPTSFPGASNGYIPGMNGKKGSQSPGRMSRTGGSTVNGTTRGRTGGRVDPRDAEIARQNQLILRLRRQSAEVQAREIISDLEREGVLFGRDPQSAEKIKYSRTEELTLAILHDEDTKDQGSPDSYVADKIDEMRLCYARRNTDNAGRRMPPQSAGVAKYARNPVQEAGATANAGADDDFEPANDQQVMELVDLQTKHKMPQHEALKYMRKKYYGK